MTIEQSEQHTNPFASNVQPLASALATKSRIPLSIVSFDMTLPQSRQHMDATAFGSVLLGDFNCFRLVGWPDLATAANGRACQIQ